jgi:NADH-quinone oxidoreductase subunit B
VEVRREPTGPPGGHGARGAAGSGALSETLRVRSHDAQELLRGGELLGRNAPGQLEGERLERYVQERVVTTTLDSAVAWARSNSFFPLAFGLACCAMEQFHAAGPRMDIARFGYEAFRASPRQADLIILAGRVSIKMAPVIRRLYDQMLEPKWAISMGACCSSMGVFNNYALVPADKFLPIDVHVPGCPPRPEALMHGVLKLRQMVQRDPAASWRERYEAHGTEEHREAPAAETVLASRGAGPLTSSEMAAAQAPGDSTARA